MPVCKKCNKPFPNRIKINGKVKIINKRKFCLECSPFGEHNTSSYGPHGCRCKKDNYIKILDCTHHGIVEFRWNGGKYRCKKCQSESVSKRRKLLKTMAVQYKGGKCCKCGYNKYPQVLEFHHRDPEKKDFGIASNGYTISWNKLKKEIDKCDILCANCHRELEIENDLLQSTRAGSRDEVVNLA